MGDGPFDLVFADPPYGAAPAALLDALAPVIAPGGLAVVEGRRGAGAPVPPEGLVLHDDRGYGDTRILIFRREGEA
jgi:16S rRNA G966 N2-methylase RsmD